MFFINKFFSVEPIPDHLPPSCDNDILKAVNTSMEYDNIDSPTVNIEIYNVQISQSGTFQCSVLRYNNTNTGCPKKLYF